MALKALFAAIVAAAVGVGFILPAHRGSNGHAMSQIEQIELRP